MRSSAIRALLTTFMAIRYLSFWATKEKTSLGDIKEQYDAVSSLQVMLIVYPFSHCLTNPKPKAMPTDSPRVLHLSTY